MSSILKVDTLQENTSANGITVDGLNIKDSKLVTANSVVASNITADAVDATKIADDAISEEHLDVTAITGHTAETSIATDDLILISDTSASGALKKMTRANFVSGIGGTNTPAFEARLSSGDVTLSNDTATKLNINDEIYDSNNCYDNSSNYRFTPTTSGKYYVYGSIYYQGSATDNIKSFQTMLYKNGSPIKVSYLGNPNEPFQSGCIMIACVTDMNGSSNYLELFAHSEFSTGNVYVKSRVDTFFGAYKLIT